MNQLPRKTIYLFLVLVAVVALTVFVLWKGFTEPTSEPAQVEGANIKVDLDFSLLESEEVKNLKLFKAVPEATIEMKRGNPFSPYTVDTSSSE